MMTLLNVSFEGEFDNPRSSYAGEFALQDYSVNFTNGKSIIINLDNEYNLHNAYNEIKCFVQSACSETISEDELNKAVLHLNDSYQFFSRCNSTHGYIATLAELFSQETIEAEADLVAYDDHKELYRVSYTNKVDGQEDSFLAVWDQREPNLVVFPDDWHHGINEEFYIEEDGKIKTPSWWPTTTCYLSQGEIEAL